LHGLRREQQFARDRIANELLDTRSAMAAARRQLHDTERNVELAAQLVAAEQRAFDLGRSDLLRIQLREVTLADARASAIDARLGLLLAHTDYRAALGFGDAP
ncbi:MAG: TolC family protein, partial [Planctomycetes bacterium]|nr:TolC family protein [Planctomycetota bacterium]